MPRRPTHPLPAVADAIRAARGNIAAAARTLGLTRQALSELIARHPDLAAIAARSERTRRTRCPTCRGRGTVAAG